MLWSRGVRRDIGQVDFGFHYAGEFNLSFFGRLAQALQGLAVLAQINALFLLELTGNPLDNCLIPVVAAQVGVPIGGAYLDHAISHIQDANVKSAASQVKDEDGLILLLIKPIRQGSRGRFIDYPQHFQSGNSPGVFGCLALTVIEVCRNCNHRLGNRFAQISFGIGF